MTQGSQQKEALWTPTFIALSGINFGAALPFYLTMVIMTDFSMETYGVGYGVGAITVTAFIISALVTRFLLGGKLDDWGLKRMLAIGMALNVVAFVSYLAPLPFALLVAMRIVQGIGFAISSGSAAAAVALILAPSRRAEGIGYFSMMQALATGIGPFVAVLFRNLTGSYFALFLFTAFLAAISLASVAILRIGPAGGRKAGGPGKLQQPKRGISRFLHTSVLLFTPTLFLVFLGYSGIVSFVVSFANESGLGDAVGLYFVLYAIAILATRPSIGRHVDRKGERPLIYLTIMSVAVGLVVLALSANGAMLLASSVLLGFGIGATQSILQAVIARDTPPHDLGRANSTFFMSMDLGAGVGPVLIGAFIPQIGFAGCYIALAASAVLACAFYALAGRRFTESISR